MSASRAGSGSSKGHPASARYAAYAASQPPSKLRGRVNGLQHCGGNNILEKAAAISRRQAAHFFILEENNQRAVLLRVERVERLRVRETERIQLHSERARHCDV
jgi:hypothetical protein